MPVVQIGRGRRGCHLFFSLQIFVTAFAMKLRRGSGDGRAAGGGLSYRMSTFKLAQLKRSNNVNRNVADFLYKCLNERMREQVKSAAQPIGGRRLCSAKRRHFELSCI